MKITEIGASVKRELDAGYAPYMRYLEELAAQRRAPAFGTREQTKAEVAVWAKATLDEGEDPEAQMTALIDDLDQQALTYFTQAYPESVTAPKSGEAGDEFSYREVKTAINPQGGPVEW